MSTRLFPRCATSIKEILQKMRKSGRRRKRKPDVPAKKPEIRVARFWTNEAEVRVRIKALENPAPQSSFGFAGNCYAITSENLFRYGVLTLPIHSSFIKGREIDRSTARLFRWDSEKKMFQLEPASGVDPDWQTVSGHITGPGIFTVIGLPSNPWVRETISILSRFSPLLNDRHMRGMLLPPICNLILCARPEFQRTLAGTGMSQLGLPPFPTPGDPGGTLCEMCLAMNGPLPEFEILENLEGDVPILKTSSRSPGFSLSEWLTNNPTIANAIVWREAGAASQFTGVPKSYFYWSLSQQSDLADTFWKIHDGYAAGLSATPPVSLYTRPSSGSLESTGLDPQLAWKYFIAHVAQSLVSEIAQWVPWTISSFTASELELLFDSHSLFEYRSNIGEYTIEMASPLQPILFDHGAATPGDPYRTFQFLRTNSLIGNTTRETIERVLEWCRTNLLHFTGGYQPANLQSQWQ